MSVIEASSILKPPCAHNDDAAARHRKMARGNNLTVRIVHLCSGRKNVWRANAARGFERGKVGTRTVNYGGESRMAPGSRQVSVWIQFCPLTATYVRPTLRSICDPAVTLLSQKHYDQRTFCLSDSSMVFHIRLWPGGGLRRRRGCEWRIHFFG